MKPENLSIILSVLIAAFGLSGCNAQIPANPPVAEAGITRSEIIASADEALQLLIEGNSRFRAGKPAAKNLGEARREELKEKGQHPFAAVLACSDSRVPPELVFDQSLGDLFEIRVAGNIVDPQVTGSIEYAVEHLKTPLIVVMGHEKCGAVTAAVEGGEAQGSIPSILGKIKPAVDKAKGSGSQHDELVEKASAINVEAAKAQLLRSPIIKDLVDQGKVKIKGAQYQLGTGTVVWQD